MGKKRAVEKTKESSSTTENQGPRKRGRPRKVTEKTEGKQEEIKTAEEFQDSEGDKQKKLEEIRGQEEGSSSKSQKEEEKSEDKELLKQQLQPPRSRASRKSKPRKSS